MLIILVELPNIGALIFIEFATNSAEETFSKSIPEPITINLLKKSGKTNLLIRL